jgi:hypothetical protein
MTDDFLPIQPENPASYRVPLMGSGALLAVAAVCALAVRPPALTAAAVTGALGLMLGGLGAARAVLAQRRRCWIAVRPEGFVLTAGEGEAEQFIRDDQVVAMTLDHLGHFTEGRLTALSRHFKVWVATPAGQPQPVEMIHTYPPDQEDPLGPLVERVTRLLLDRARAELQAGQRVLGAGWSLDRQALTVQQGKATVRLALADLAAVDVVNHRICLWKRGQDEAVTRVPLGAANAHLLAALLNEHLATTRQPEPDPTPDHLGRIFFERRPMWGDTVGLALVALAVAGLGAFLISAAASDAILPQVAEVLCAVGAAGFAVAAVNTRWSVIRCHAHGLYRQHLLGARRIFYHEAARFTFRAVRKYREFRRRGRVIGTIFTGLEYTLTLEPPPAQGGKGITIRRTTAAPNAALEDLRDYVARVMARRLLAELLAGRSVEWTEGHRFTPQGLAWLGLFGRPGGTPIPYQAITVLHFVEGALQLHAQGAAKSSLEIPVSAPNFYPGFVLLTRLVSPEVVAPPGGPPPVA